jgi:hypothetical protein
VLPEMGASGRAIQAGGGAQTPLGRPPSTPAGSPVGGGGGVAGPVSARPASATGAPASTTRGIAASSRGRGPAAVGKASPRHPTTIDSDAHKPTPTTPVRALILDLHPTLSKCKAAEQSRKIAPAQRANNANLNRRKAASPRAANRGERGIRTLGTFRYTRFPIVPLRPLGHLSNNTGTLGGFLKPPAMGSAERSSSDLDAILRPSEHVLVIQFSEKLRGEGGSRTHVGLAPKPDFESGAFGHSATSPVVLVRANVCRVDWHQVKRGSRAPSGLK